MNANLPKTDSAQDPLPILLSVAALSRRLDVSETPIAAAIADGRLTPDAMLARSASTNPSALFSANRVAEIREVLFR